MPVSYKQRRALTQRRFAAIATLFRRLAGAPAEPWELTSAEFDAELRKVKAGEKKAAARRPTPRNSNSDAISILRAAHPNLYTGELTIAKAHRLNSWLRKNHPTIRKRTDDALQRAINRSRSPKKR
ncbi:MAG: hypothetical protein ABI769_18115 [Pseudomonadota bacterium]